MTLNLLSPWNLLELNSLKSEYHSTHLHTWDLSENDFEPIAKETIELCEKVYKDIGTMQPLSENSSNIIESLAEVDRFCYGRLRLFGLYIRVSESKAVRDAAAAARTLLDSFQTQMLADEDVYRALRSFEERNAFSLKPLELRFLKRALFKRSLLGLDLPNEADRQSVAELTRRELALCDRYRNNAFEDVTVLEFDAEQLDGVPAETLDSMERSSNGKHRVTLKYPHYFPVMRFCRVRATRAAVEHAFHIRCKANAPLLREIIQIRHRRAKLLGYATHAESVLCDRMAKSAESVQQFLSSLVARFTPLLERELSDFADVLAEEEASAPTSASASVSEARGHQSDGDGDGEGDGDNADIVSVQQQRPLPPLLTRDACAGVGVGGGAAAPQQSSNLLALCDLTYVCNRVEERHFAVDHKLLREYFPLPDVLQVLLAHYQFQVNDQDSGELMGFFYLDLFPRDGKFHHAMCYDLQVSARLPNGERQLPIAAMLCNLPRASANAPSLLRHGEVCTLFHEFGHVMHLLCARSDYRLLSSPEVERDFLEMPSKMFENWIWEPRFLTRLGRHYRTGEPLPAALVQSLAHSRIANAGVNTLRLVAMAMIDLQLHHQIALNPPPSQELAVDSARICAENFAKIARLYVDPDVDLTESFGHLFDGYDAQFYGYLWSEAFSCEMYASHFEQPADRTPEAAAQAEAAAGLHLRRAVFEPAATRDAAALLEEFLGHAPDPHMRAFLVTKGVLDV